MLTSCGEHGRIETGNSEVRKLAASDTTPEALRAEAKELRRGQDAAAAETRLRAALEKYRASDPKLTSKDAAACRQELADVLADQGKLDEALVEAHASLDAMLAIFPEDKYLGGTEETSRSGWTLGRVLLEMGRPEEAEKALFMPNSWFEGLRGGTWEAAVTASLIGTAVAQQGRFQQAENAVITGYIELRKYVGPEHPETIAALWRVIDFYNAWGKPEKAASYQRIAGDVNAPAAIKPQ